MGMSTGNPLRNWVMFTSSSGETFRQMWNRLPNDARLSLKAIFADRASAAEHVARTVAPNVPYYRVPKDSFERTALDFLQRPDIADGMVLLCGFFGILTESFLQKNPLPVINTHPSLLPSFPGLEKRVHEEASRKVAVSGFTIHMVTPELDGGPILFQQPVWLDPRKDSEQHRLDVRQAEQAWLPVVWNVLLRSSLRKEDQNLDGLELRRKVGIVSAGFEERPAT
jgi:folate-dependent phosphoribosylglycinamide formyltransferase PurN